MPSLLSLENSNGSYMQKWCKPKNMATSQHREIPELSDPSAEDSARPSIRKTCRQDAIFLKHMCRRAHTHTHRNLFFHPACSELHKKSVTLSCTQQAWPHFFFYFTSIKTPSSTYYLKILKMPETFLQSHCSWPKMVFKQVNGTGALCICICVCVCMRCTRMCICVQVRGETIGST